MGTYFDIDELCASDTARRRGLDNTPSAAEEANLQALIDNVLDPARARYGAYIRVNSGYRSAALNAAVGGAANSQHRRGEAADITGGSIAKNKRIFEVIARYCPFDSLIWEKGGQWVHVSYKTYGNRGQILSYDGAGYTDITSRWADVVLA